jgi:type III pantothenate kinase
MVNLSLNVQCIDIGNSISHFGTYKNGVLVEEQNISTQFLIEKPTEFPNFKESNISYCSVVPKAEKELLKLATLHQFKLYNLNFKSKGEFPINYPHPNQIGQDRIANSLAAYHSVQLPSIVIDIGTATTFDVISQNGGYEGGVIAPGPQGFLDFLSQNTALLPKVKISEKHPNSIIGRETKDAMLIGTKIGYPAMVHGIITNLKKEIKRKFRNEPTLIITGGGIGNLKLENSIFRKDLTIYGLALAFQLNSK